MLNLFVAAFPRTSNTISKFKKWKLSCFVSFRFICSYQRKTLKYAQGSMDSGQGTKPDGLNKLVEFCDNRNNCVQISSEWDKRVWNLFWATSWRLTCTEQVWNCPVAPMKLKMPKMVISALSSTSTVLVRSPTTTFFIVKNFVKEEIWFFFFYSIV